MLATEGLVELLPNRSALVRQVTDEMINELVPIVGTLEALAGRIACARIDEAALAEVEALHERLLQHLDQRDEASYMEIEDAILRAVFNIAGNKSLMKFYETLTVKLQWQAACHQTLAEWQQTAEVLHRAALLLRGVERLTGGTTLRVPGWDK